MSICRRYGLLGPNGCGKSLLMHILGRKMLPFPDSIDVFHVDSEIEPTEMTALEAVLSVDSERAKLEAEAEHLSKLAAEAEVCVVPPLAAHGSILVVVPLRVFGSGR
jgi:ATPase subunit of ABC transporter with duplicated ATPase domains